MVDVVLTFSLWPTNCTTWLLMLSMRCSLFVFEAYRLNVEEYQVVYVQYNVICI